MLANRLPISPEEFELTRRGDFAPRAVRGFADGQQDDLRGFRRWNDRSRTRRLCRRFESPRLVDAFAPCPCKNFGIEALKSWTVIEMLEMGELVAQRIHETRIFEGLARGRMTEPNPNRAIRKANAVSAFYIGPLRFERSKPQAKARADSLRIDFETAQEFLLRPAIQLSPPTRGVSGSSRVPSTLTRVNHICEAKLHNDGSNRIAAALSTLRCRAAA